MSFAKMLFQNVLDVTGLHIFQTQDSFADGEGFQWSDPPASPVNRSSPEEEYRAWKRSAYRQMYGRDGTF